MNEFQKSDNPQLKGIGNLLARCERVKKENRGVDADYAADPLNGLACQILDMIDAGHSTDVSVLHAELVSGLLLIQSEAAQMLKIVRGKP